MHGSRLHGEDGLAAILDKLVEHRLGIVVFTVGQSCKRAHANHVAIAAHDGDGLQQVFRLVAIHDDAPFGLQLPGTCIHVEHNDIHAQVHGSLLGRQTGAQ